MSIRIIDDLDSSITYSSPAQGHHWSRHTSEGSNAGSVTLTRTRGATARHTFDGTSSPPYSKRFLLIIHSSIHNPITRCITLNFRDRHNGLWHHLRHWNQLRNPPQQLCPRQPTLRRIPRHHDQQSPKPRRLLSVAYTRSRTPHPHHH